MKFQGLNLLELVYSLEKGGRTQRLLATTSGLQRKGYCVKTITFNPPPDWVKQRWLDSSQLLVMEKQPGFDFHLIRNLLNFIKKENITCVHAHCESSNLFGGIAAKLARIPIISTFHRTHLDAYQYNLRWLVSKPLLRYKVAVSYDRARLMKDNLKVRSNRLRVIHGGIDIDRFRPDTPENRTIIRERLGITKDRLVLLSLGHLGPCKGHDITLQAMNKIVQTHPTVQLFIGGDGSQADYQRLQSLVALNQLEKYITFLGQVHDPVIWYQASDLFVQPSLEEAFGLVFAEAGACGLPVVSTTVGGIPEIVQHDETGLLVAPRTSEAVADAVVQLLSSPVKRKAMGEAARHHIATHFSLDQMIDKYDRLIKTLTSPFTRR